MRPHSIFITIIFYYNITSIYLNTIIISLIKNLILVKLNYTIWFYTSVILANFCHFNQPPSPPPTPSTLAVLTIKIFKKQTRCLEIWFYSNVPKIIWCLVIEIWLMINTRVILGQYLPFTNVKVQRPGEFYTSVPKIWSYDVWLHSYGSEKQHSW